MGEVGCLVGLMELSVGHPGCSVAQVDLTGVVKRHGNKSGRQSSLTLLVASGFV